MTRVRSVPEITLIGWGFLLNGIWEFLQSPLYADHDRGTIYILWSRLHCTAGDNLRSCSALNWIASLVFRTRSWPTEKSDPALLVFIAVRLHLHGLERVVQHPYGGYMVLRAFHAPGFRTGASPLLQWLLIPVALVFLLKRSGRS